MIPVAIIYFSVKHGEVIEVVLKLEGRHTNGCSDYRKNGKPEWVVIPYSKYEKIQEAIEDIEEHLRSVQEGEEIVVSGLQDCPSFGSDDFIAACGASGHLQASTTAPCPYALNVRQTRRLRDSGMNFRFSLPVENADVQFSSMKIDAVVVSVLLIVKFHELASFHQIDYGLGVNQFYTDDVSGATIRRISRARMGP